MILARDRHIHAACFDEIDAAVASLVGRPDAVVFNAHSALAADIPVDAVVYNFENVGIQIAPVMFPGREIWDFSSANVERWRAAGRDVLHVPVGFHPSMTRFEPLPWSKRDIDVVFCGCPNPRRTALVRELRGRGLHVELLFGVYGPDRDAILQRARVGLNVLFYEDGIFPVLRSAHLQANLIATVSEEALETPSWAWPPPCPLSEVADRVERIVRGSADDNDEIVSTAIFKLAACPMTLP